MSDNIEQKVKAAIAEKLNIENPELLKNESSFAHDLGADSLDLVETIMSFEDEFGISIPDEDSEKITTVQEAIDYVKSKLG